MGVVKQFEGPICFTRIARRANKLHMQADTAPVSSAMGLMEILVYVRNINGGMVLISETAQCGQATRPPWGHGWLSSHKDCFMVYVMDWWLERRRLMW